LQQNRLSDDKSNYARDKWYNEECRAAVEKRSKDREKYIKNDTLKDLYEFKWRKCKKTIQREKRKYLNMIMQTQKSIVLREESDIFSKPPSNIKNLIQNGVKLEMSMDRY
jgi:hypothetical protein